MRRYSLLQPAFVGAAQEWRICNQGVAPLRNFPAASRPKAKLRSLLIRELAHLLPHPYWQTRLTSPFSKGETGLGTLATFFPPHSCPSHELRGSVDVKASHTHSSSEVQWNDRGSLTLEMPKSASLALPSKSSSTFCRQVRVLSIGLEHKAARTQSY